MFFFDPLYLLFAAPALILALFAQARVSGTYGKFSKVRNIRGITGAEAAQHLLRAKGLGHIVIEPTHGELTDHYDPGKKVLRLSEGVYRSTSVAALGIAAHEVGHAYQDHDHSYVFMRVRSTLVPVANLGSNLGVWLAMIGAMISMTPMVAFGVVLFSAAVLFTLVTLPVEFNASNRAMAALRTSGLVTTTEYDGARAVLNAAALTYVAAALQSVMLLLYFVLRLVGIGRDDD